MASTLKEAARKGVLGDTRLGHLSNNDRIFPAEHVDEHTGKTRIDYRPVNLQPMSNDVQSFPPKVRVY